MKSFKNLSKHLCWQTSNHRWTSSTMSRSVKNSSPWNYMAETASGRFLRRWNKKKLVPRLTKCIAIHGDCVEK
jgi:hypothetical protein